MNKNYSIVIALLMFFNLSLFSQDGPPWDFNGTDHGFIAQNYTSITVGDTYLTYSINSPNDDGNGGSANPNFKNTAANIDTSVGGYIAITMQNLTGNARVQVITNAGSNVFTNFDGLSTNDADFVTHYINMSNASNWTGTMDNINFRFKQGNGVNDNVYSGDVLIDNIEIVASIPATPRVDYTFDNTSDSEGFSSANGVTMSQPVAGELHLDIANQSPYPKLEQTGLYSVDADTYKYVQVTLVNNSPKNKLTFVSPSGGNEYATADMTANSSDAQTVEADLSALTNWTGTQGNWWFQLVENPGDGAVASAGEMDIQQILFATESINPSSVDCSFDVFLASGGSYPSEVSWAIQDGSGSNVMSGDGYNTDVQTLEMSFGDTYTLVMSDSYGDGWNGASISVNGVSYTVPASSYEATAEIVCSSEPSMTVDATTDGGSATFSFMLENFTVGSDASADGHIHYSLNGGTEVMVYSSDDLTLTDLPNGDHTIVFSLVDANHTALDPAVTATVEFSTFDGTVACDGSLSHTYGNNESGTLFSTSNPGGTVTVTVTGQTEGGYDFLIIRDGAGNELYNASGDHTGQAITSEDGTLTVEVDSDGSVSGYTLDFAVTCGTLQANVTFTVNTANITVGDNGMYLGGGVFGGATAHAMSDADGDGTWEVTVAMDPGTTGNYIFLNSPNSDSDWGTKENLEGQDCADPANYNDRILPAIDGDMTIQHCFGSCESDGTCPAATPTYNVSFSVDMSNYPTGVGADDTVYLNGNFNGWCGDCNPMSDDDGDGIWTLTIPLEDGAYEYKFTVNGWNSQEEFTEVVEGCTVSDGTYTNRTLTVAGEDMTLPTVYWNLCAGETPGTTYNVTFSVNTANITVGETGIFIGGGFIGDAQGQAMSDDDGNGVWTVTIPVNTDNIGGNYIFLNGPGDGGDWGTKENLEGQDCADPNNYNDRIMPEFDSDVTLLACFGECSGDGTGQCSADECAAPEITSWTMTGDGAIFDGNNQDGIIGYQIEYSTSTFTPGDGTAIVYEFDTFPHTLTGLESNTTYYFTVRSICGDDNYSDWTDYGDDGPDAWTTTICPSSYSLPYLNDFNDPDTWTNCQTFYDNDGDGNFWYYVNYTDVDEAGNNVAASASYQSGAALTPDNWVIMGPIDLTDHSDALLEWKVRGIDPSWCQENYSVYVGTSDNYNDLINGSVSYNETIANGGDACGQTFAERSLDISASTGGQVYIGFRHHDVSDMFVLNVDDVSVTSTTMSNEDFTLENITYSFNQETDILRVTSEEPLSKIEIYNMLGQQVLNKNLNESSATLNLSDLSGAIYIVNVEGNNSKTKTFKLAIK